MISLTLSELVPWGRNLSEYRRMFGMQASDMGQRVLDCGAGPASFCAEACSEGWNVVACDPIYHFTPEEIRGRVEETRHELVANMERHRDQFRWEELESPQAVGERRVETMQRFLADYVGAPEGRYVAAALPELPFADNEFDVSVVSHFLFLHSSSGLAFHLAGLDELMRVSQEARFFPLLNMEGVTSEHLRPALEHARQRGWTVVIELADYEFQKGASMRLVLRR